MGNLNNTNKTPKNAEKELDESVEVKKKFPYGVMWKKKFVPSKRCMTKNFIVLNKPLTFTNQFTMSKDIRITYPSNTKLKFILIGDELIVEHPTERNIYVSVSPTDVKEFTN